MQLSVCLITRNEEKRLERALRSVTPIAGEIVITDTGSTDRTIEIAKQFGANLSHFTWCDDFSAARNFCFSQAQSDWIFWLDADEELLPGSVDLLLNCVGRTDVFAFLILRQDITDLSRPELYTEMYLPRLFRRVEHLHLIGRHHEQFCPSLSDLALQRGQTLVNSNVRIRHDGYAGTQRKSKFQRDVRLLELELQDRPGQLYYQIELYRTLLLMGANKWRSVLADAAANLRQYLNDECPPMSLVALLIETLLQLPESQIPADLTRSNLRELARRWFPRAAPLLWILAKQDYEQNRHEAAESRLRQLIRMGQDHSYDRSVGFEPRIIGAEARLNLAVCLIRQSKLDEAVEILESLRDDKDQRQAAEHNLKAIKNIRRNLPSLRPRKRKR